MARPTLLSSILAKAMAHPTRVGAMTILLGRTATPTEIAAELREPVGNVSYHLDVLQRLNCIELVAVEPARGGRVVQHFYRAVDRAFLDAEAWEELGAKERLEVTV